MQTFSLILVSSLIACTISAAVIRNTLVNVIIFTFYSFGMAMLWQAMDAPDLAVTEAAVGAGIATALFVMTLKRARSGGEGFGNK